MIKISDDALRDECERAHDLFLLNRLRAHHEAAVGFEPAYQALGLDTDRREELERALVHSFP